MHCCVAGAGCSARDVLVERSVDGTHLRSRDDRYSVPGTPYRTAGCGKLPGATPVRPQGHQVADVASTPLTDVLFVVETIYAPAFGPSIAALAVVGAATRTLGNRVAAVFGVIGGLSFALAGGTFLLTDALDPLFPVSSALAVWAVIAGAGALRARSADAG